jgi:hypothetical protein
LKTDLVFLGALYLRDLPQGEGRAVAPLVWLYLVARSNKKLTMWCSNAWIAADLGISVRAVQYALAMLKQIGRVTMSIVKVQGAKKGGRLVTLHPLGGGEIPKVAFPSRMFMAGIWRRLRKHRERAIAAVSLAAAVYVSILATTGLGGIYNCVTAPTQPSQLQSLTGSTSGGGYTARLGTLCDAGVVERHNGEFVMRQLAANEDSTKVTWNRPPDGVPMQDKSVEVEVDRSAEHREYDAWVDSQVWTC